MRRYIFPWNRCAGNPLVAGGCFIHSELSDSLEGSYRTNSPEGKQQLRRLIESDAELFCFKVSSSRESRLLEGAAGRNSWKIRFADSLNPPAVGRSIHPRITVLEVGRRV